MSIPYMNAVFGAGPETVKGADRLALLALANHADDDGVCWPSQKRLSAFCAVKERALRDTLNRLEAGGLISRTPRGRGTRYQIHLEALTPAAHCRTRDEDTGSPLPEDTGSLARDTGSPLPRHRQPTAAEPSENHQLEPPTEPPRGGAGRSVGFSGDVETDAAVAAVISALTDPDPKLAEKVRSLIAEHDLTTVRDHAGGLARQGKPFGFGALLQSVRNGWDHPPPDRPDRSPAERAVIGDARRARLVESGGPAEHFLRTTDGAKGEARWMYLPNGPKRSPAASGRRETTSAPARRLPEAERALERLQRDAEAGRPQGNVPDWESDMERAKQDQRDRLDAARVAQARSSRPRSARDLPREPVADSASPHIAVPPGSVCGDGRAGEPPLPSYAAPSHPT